MVAALGSLLFVGCRSSKTASTDAVTEATPVTPPTEQVTKPVEKTPVVPEAPSITNTKTTETKTSSSKKSKVEEVVTTPSYATNVEAMTAKMNLKLESRGKSFSVGGTYRLKRNEVIQINLTYTMIITINLGTLELTPDYILVIDRIHKRYCQVAYSEVPMLAQYGIGFDYIQSIFWGEAGSSPASNINWEYANWTSFGEGKFPTKITFTMDSGADTYKATFNLSSLKQSDNWETHTTVSSKFTPMSLESVLTAIMNYTK